MKNLFAYALAGWVFCLQGALAQTVDIKGCPKAADESGCIVLKSKGKTYDISAANPKIDLKRHLMIRLHGTIDPDQTACMNGIRLKVLKWDYEKMSCPVPKKK